MDTTIEAGELATRRETARRLMIEKAKARILELRRSGEISRFPDLARFKDYNIALFSREVERLYREMILEEYQEYQRDGVPHEIAVARISRFYNLKVCLVEELLRTRELEEPVKAYSSLYKSSRRTRRTGLETLQEIYRELHENGNGHQRVPRVSRQKMFTWKKSLSTDFGSEERAASFYRALYGREYPLTTRDSRFADLLEKIPGFAEILDEIRKRPDTPLGDILERVTGRECSPGEIDSLARILEAYTGLPLASKTPRGEKPKK